MTIFSENIIGTVKTGQLLLAGFLLAVLASPSRAAIDAYEFNTGEQEQRFKEIIAEMRCPMCLNSNIAGSDAPIAADLRAEVHDQILAGQTDEEIMEFMISRYGNFITYRPPLNSGTFFLWFGPLLFLMAGFFMVRRTMKGSQEAPADGELNPEEKRKLQKILSSQTDQ